MSVGGDNVCSVFSGVLQNGTGTLALVKSGTGTLTLTGANTYTGGTTISGGILQLGNGGSAGSITGPITDNGQLSLDRSDSGLILSGAISGTGTLVQMGTGTSILTGTNTYTGGTTISAGTLQLGNGGSTGSITGNIVDSGVLRFNRTDTGLNLGGNITGTGSVVQAGTGTSILSGTNTYSGRDHRKCRHPSSGLGDSLKLLLGFHGQRDLKPERFFEFRRFLSRHRHSNQYRRPGQH